MSDLIGLDKENGRIPEGTGLSPSAAPVSAVASVPASIPCADDTIQIGGKSYLRFHPLHKKVRDDAPRCFACGQIDEPEWHESQWCPAHGGALPFPTSTLKLKLRADNGFRCEATYRLTLEQWVAINQILNSDSDGSPEGGDAKQGAIVDDSAGCEAVSPALPPTNPPIEGE